MTITKDIVDKAISSDSELSTLRRSDAVFIPVYGNDVTEIGDEAFVSCNGITTFKFPSELQNVGYRAFAECSSLISVDMSYTDASSVGYMAFAKCHDLKNVCLPGGKSISAGDYAFWQCSSLTAVSTDSELCLCRGVFDSCKSIVDTRSMPNVKSIGQYCFNNSGILSCMLDNCQYVDINAFMSDAECHFKHVSAKSLLSACGQLVYYNYPMFCDADDLTCISMPSLSIINCGFIDNCNSMSNISLPALEEMHGRYAFAVNCSALTAIDLPMLKTTHQQVIRHCIAVSSLDLPSLTSLDGTPVAKDCASLTSVSMPQLKSFSKIVENCDSFISAYVDNEVYHSINDGQVISRTDNDNDWIWVSDKLDQVVNDSITTMPALPAGIKIVSCKNVTHLASNDMTSRAALKYVNLPSLEDADIDFSNCTSLLSLDFSNAKTLFGNDVDAFDDTNSSYKNCLAKCTSLSAVTLPHEGIRIFGANNHNSTTVLHGTKLYNDLVASGNTLIKLETYCLKELDDVLTAYVDNDVTLVGPFAFNGMSFLMNVDCPNCKYVNQFAFSECGSLIDVKMDNVEEIGSYGFAYCVSLTSVSFPKVKKLGSYAFAEDTSLVEVNLPQCTELCAGGNFSLFAGTSISLPACKSIGESPFAECPNLQVIDLPCIESFKGIAIDCPELVSAVMSSLTAVPKVDPEYAGSTAFDSVHPDFKIYVNSSIYNEMMSDDYWLNWFGDIIVAI